MDIMNYIRSGCSFSFHEREMKKKLAFTDLTDLSDLPKS